jgi:hypothetical protein
MTMSRLIVTMATGFALAVPALSWADNTTCANAEPLMLGETAADTLPASGSVFYKLRLVAGRSYTMMAWAPFEDLGEGGSDLNVSTYPNTTCSGEIFGSGDSEPSLAFPNADGDANSFIATVSGNYRLEVQNQTATAYAIRAVVIETTLFSPWWFVGGNNNAFVEIKNTTNASRSITLTAHTSAGAVCGSSTVAIPANGNTVINIKGLGTCAAAVSGGAQISHEAQVGGFVANTTTIDGVAGTSFDAPFTPRMGWGVSFTAR